MAGKVKTGDFLFFFKLGKGIPGVANGGIGEGDFGGIGFSKKAGDSVFYLILIDIFIAS